ncbi:MAG: GNAT family N-acetyltransferase [Clostridiales bacterium]|nr:GNAT family N-acetyltransferase [Clostridiales bacterium]
MEELRGERISIRGFTREEWHDFWRGYENDPLSGMSTSVYEETACEKRYRRALTQTMEHPRLGIFLPDGTPVGLLGLKGINRDRGYCSFGIVMQNDSRKNQGYGTEALRVLFAFVFEGMGLKRIYASTMGSNKRMQHLFTKLGFRYMDTNWAWFKLPDRREDRLNYVLPRSARDMRVRDYAFVRALPALARNLRRKLRKETT